MTSVYGSTVPTTAFYSGQTLTLGGSAVTFTNVVVVVSPGLAGPSGATHGAGSGANTNDVVSTNSTPVISLGVGGLEVANPNTRASMTSVYGSTVPTTVVYSGQTLTLGGPDVTVTNNVGVSRDTTNQTGASNMADISFGSADPTSGTTAAGTGSTPIAAPSPNSSANKVSGGVVGLLLALMTSIWV
ncbi:uncharacterized protein N7529_006486 [Penicillium soppii]|jgi:hypothetical protein|uniref:uncharacterized protein n=1 Tax=Penicillium soppii TaxID=69789 RepID=UPI00254696D9|nr:uncharacterized protein N7529_006486 [Penicillium soppii]KAJ5864570.1 hypothetical protein N7529_006486 [Penicillium soppii]